MSQIMNVFRKDAQHHWGEIVLCQAALLIFVVNEVHGWKAHDEIYGIGRFWPVAIGALLPITWWILIVRIVQSESLVGDRQFWITRPYEWKKLLLSKILFVFVFINLPLLGAQIFLLAKAGFEPMHYFGGVLWMQLLLIQIPILPITALAVVTRNVAQGALAVLAVLLFIAGMVALDSVLSQSAAGSTDASDWIQAVVFTLACVMAIYVQYARRRTTRARMFLVVGAALIVLVFVVTPHVVHGERDYPALATAPLRASLSPVKPGSSKSEPDKNEPVELDLPIIATGLSGDSVAQVNAVMLSIETPDGRWWSSKWQPAYRFLLPGQNSWTQDFKVPYERFAQARSVSANIRVTLGFTVFHDQGLQQITATKGDFAVPGVGRCWINAKNSTVIQCLSPLLKPAMLLLRTEAVASTCADIDEQSSPGDHSAYAWEWNDDSGPAEYGVSPVESFELYLDERDTKYRGSLVCPGTRLSFSFPTFTERTRVEFEVSGIKLEDYRPQNFRFLLAN